MADFWFDPICPWTWLTSRWLVEVQHVRDVPVTWRLMSIAVLNEGGDVPAEYEQVFVDSWQLLRLLAAADMQQGQDAMAQLYTAIGRRAFEQGDTDIASVAAAALAQTGLEELAPAALDTGLDEAIRASHAEGMALVGDDVGSPVLRAGANAFSGPVVTPAPTGERAGQLWDALLVMSDMPEVYEIKRTRDSEPDFG